MQVKAFILTAITAATASAAATEFDSFSDGGCGAYQTTIFTDESDGSCQQLGATGSIKTNKVGGGCTVTVYTDSNCTDGPVTAGLGQCVTGGWASYSVDC